MELEKIEIEMFRAYGTPALGTILCSTNI